MLNPDISGFENRVDQDLSASQFNCVYTSQIPRYPCQILEWNKSAAGMQHTPPRDIFNVSNVNQGL